MRKKSEFACEVSNILVKTHALTQDRSHELCRLFKERSKDTFDNFVIEEGLVDKPALLQALSTYFDVPAFDAEGYYFDHHLVRMFPKDVLLRNEFIPVERDEETLIVVASNPHDPALAEIINQYVSYDVTFLVGLYRDIKDAVEDFYDESLGENVFAQVDDYRMDEELHEAQDAQRIIDDRES